MKNLNGRGASGIEAAVKALAGPVVDDLGYELVDVEYSRQDGELCLSVYIDKNDGTDVSLDDCEKVSKKLDPMIDGLTILTDSYNFEVSSPGLDRPLRTDRDFEKYRGQLVDVKLFVAFEGGKLHTGSLQGLIDGFIVIVDSKGVERRFPKEKVAQVKRTIEF